MMISNSAKHSGSAPVRGATQLTSALRFVFIAPVLHEEFYKAVKRGMKDAGSLMNAEVTFTGTPGVDLKAQSRIITRAASEGYHGIAVNLIDPYAFNSAVKRALKRGVPVVAFNTDAGTTNARLSAICQNPIKAGRELGVYAASLAKGNKTVLITMHDRGISCLEQRCEGIAKVLKDRGIRSKIAYCHSTPLESAEVISDLLRRDDTLRVICGTGQADTEGAGLAVEREGAQGYRSVVGFDLSAEILRLMRSGVIKYTVDQQPYLQGFYPVIQLALFCRYGLKPSDIDCGTAIIARSTLAKIERLSSLGVR